MKFLLALGVLFFGYQSMAASQPLLLSSHSTSGLMVPNEERVTTDCFIYADKIFMTQSVGLINTVKTLNFSLTGDFVSMAKDADSGTIQNTLVPWDGAVLQTYAYYPLNGQIKKVILFDYNGGNKELENQSKTAGVLSKLIKNLCK